MTKGQIEALKALLKYPARAFLLFLALSLVASLVSYIPAPKQETVTAPEVQAPTITTETERATPPPVTYDTMIMSRDWSGEQEEIMKKLAMAEAESESTTVKALVILCFLNRMWSPDFPNTMEEVLLQEGQFTPISDGRYFTAVPDEDCEAAMRLVKSGWDQSQGCMWYESCDGGSEWHDENLELVYSLGNMRFYKAK